MGLPLNKNAASTATSWNGFGQATVPGVESLAAARSPLVIFCNGVGDHLLTLPAIRALAHLFPDRLALACLANASKLFFGDVSLASVHTLHIESVHDGIIEYNADMLARSVGGCDLLIYLNRALSRSAQRTIELLRPTKSIGLFPCFSESIPFFSGVHASEVAFAVAKKIDAELTIGNFSQPPSLGLRHTRAASQLRSALPPGSQVLAVHGETSYEKMWPLPKFHEALKRLLSNHIYMWAFVLCENTESAAALAGARIISCCGIPLATSLAIVGNADCFLGVDSCMLHAADLFRTPAVGLFGPTDPAEFGVHFSPSSTHVRAGRSMKDIKVEDVVSAVEHTLRARPQRLNHEDGLLKSK